MLGTLRRVTKDPGQNPWFFFGGGLSDWRMLTLRLAQAIEEDAILKQSKTLAGEIA